MRTAFIKTLEEEASIDKDIFLIVGDLGFGVVTKFAEKYPDQFLNAGIAEQNMTGMAAGIAMSGKKVITYSIANFPTLRPFEQIRNDICYHNANVKIVAVGGGFCYGALGPTHFATEDLAVMQALPNMTVLAPGDPWEAEAATRAMLKYNGPVYLRLGRAGEPEVHSGKVDFQIGKSIQVRQGSDISLIAIGGMVYNATKAADALKEKGINARVISVGSLKPFDESAILNAAKDTGNIISIEEHSLIGGLGSKIAEILAEHRLSPNFKRLGVPSEFPSRVGDQEWFINHYKLDVQSIVNQSLVMLGKEF